MHKFTYFVLFAVAAGICSAQNYNNYNYNQNYLQTPTITVQGSSGVTPLMEQDAVELLRRALDQVQRTHGGNQCVLFRDTFSQRYPDYTWHVLKSNAYAIKFVKRIDLAAGNDRYVLFATRK